MYAKIGIVKLVSLILVLSFPHIVLSDELQKGYRRLHNSTIPFLNGINAPWKAFGTDVGKHPNWGVLHEIHFFDSLFTEVAKAGGNSVRWWVHCDGRSTPEFDNSGMVTGLDPEFFVHFDAILNSAAQRGILLMPVLWSFDMANDNTGGAGPYGGKHITLITDSACTRSYIDNCLIPLVKRYEKHPALLAWEICNEPEWMLDSDGSTLQRTNAKQLQTWIGRLASAIRKQNPAALVTVGSASLKWNWNNPTGTERNLWSDSALHAATGDSLSYLDFYEVHYYSWMIGSTWSYSPFDFHARRWKLDKPVLIGELPGKGQAGYKTILQMYRWALDSSYAGAMGWSFIGTDQEGSWNDIKPAIQAINALPVVKTPGIEITAKKGEYFIAYDIDHIRNINRYSVYTMSGKTVPQNTKTILSKGIYILKVKNSVIKNR